jgi:hypothetical protein
MEDEALAFASKRCIWSYLLNVSTHDPKRLLNHGKCHAICTKFEDWSRANKEALLITGKSISALAILSILKPSVYGMRTPLITRSNFSFPSLSIWIAVHGSLAIVAGTRNRIEKINISIAIDLNM